MSAGALERLDENARREYWAALALRCTRGLGASLAARLLRRFGTAYDAVCRKELWSEEGVPASALAFFQKQEWREAARPEWEAAHRLDAHVILWTDPRYPALLREIADAPVLLYAAGDLSLLAGPCVAVVGSRNCSRAALDFAGRVSAELASAGVTVVSGLAMGVDTAAHREALGRTGSTVAVLAGGIDVPYPAANIGLYRRILQEGLVLSEFPPGTKPRRYSFPVRNRVMSGLSLAVLVAEATETNSGSLLTAHLAAEQGREVCVPSPELFSGRYPEGSKSLLLEGASPVAGAEDLMAGILPQLKAALKQRESGNAERRIQTEQAPKPAVLSRTAKPRTAAVRRGAAKRAKPQEQISSPVKAPCSPDEQTLLELLASSASGPEDLLCAAQERDPSWTPARVTAALMMLEVARRIRRTADSRYEVCP